MKIINLKNKIIVLVIILLTCVLAFFLGSSLGTNFWKANEPKAIETKLQDEQFKFIAELATVDAYYHNVTKVYDKDYEEWLWIDKPLNFWIDSEYIVTYGLDADLITFSIKDNVVTVTIPEARVLKKKNSVNENNTYVARDSVDVGTEELKIAYKETEDKINKSAKANTLLLEKAQLQAKQLITNYINKVGSANNINYEIKWIEVDQGGKPIKK